MFFRRAAASHRVWKLPVDFFSYRRCYHPAAERPGDDALKILLSAFACEPNVGSELAVGWNWALSLARAGHRVVVLTRARSRPAIERAMADGLSDLPLRFEYFDLPEAMRWEVRGPLHLHTALWQWRALGFARRLHDRERFDCVHHVTFAGLRVPSFMGKLGIPFIFGPVGGGERAPWSLRRGYSLGGLIYDAARDAANSLIQFTPFMIGTFESAERIYVTSRETLHLMPRRFRAKVRIELAIGAEQAPAELRPSTPSGGRRGGAFRVLYAGRFVDYKGMHLGLPAFARLLRAEPHARLTMVGEGGAKRRWEKLAEGLGIAANIDWLPWQNREAMAALYAEHDVLLFPAMHDSGGMVVLEAMDCGVPVVCLKLGGPATLVDESCGHAVDPTGKDAAQVIRELGDALVGHARERSRPVFAEAARRRCLEFSWPQKVARIYGPVS
jgi:glycosyltransferase involved in cell wall biosynthesis